MMPPNVPSPAPKERYRGHVESMGDGYVHGWVVSVPNRGAALPVGLFFKDKLLSMESAGFKRDDLAGAGYGDGRHGFMLPISDAQIHMIMLGGGEVSVRVMDGSRFEVGRFAIGSLVREDPRARHHLTRNVVQHELGTLAQIIDRIRTSTDGQTRPAADAAYNALFASDDAVSPDAASAYLSLAMARAGKTVDPDADPFSALDWYVSTYGPQRLGRRIPLSREQIECLNEPVAIGNSGYELTRIAAAKLRSNEHLADGIGAPDETWYSAVLYWWSIHHARNMHAEDCLVPDWMADRLRTVREVWNVPDYPFSVFMEHWYLENPQTHFLDLGRIEDRMVFSAILLIKAIERPDFLRFIPQGNIDALLLKQNSYWNSLFDLLYAIDGNQDFSEIDYIRYARILKAAGYDMFSGTFSSVTPLGHRLDAARFPRPDKATGYDVQVIGPLSRASGLGQAARLSADMLRHTPFSTNAVDFTLDDPGSAKPGGPARHGAFARSRINLIHLNGDLLPSALAYAPDVFTGAYNIGYFFWELDSPTVPDHFAFTLLDEIWVASDFNLAVYSGASGIPVTKVGMCFEPLPVPDRRESRQVLQRHLSLGGHEFVFMATLDSFSYVQRKNPLGVIDAFQRAFPDDPGVRLLLKTQNRARVSDPAQGRIWALIDERASADPRIMLYDETLSYDRLLQLKHGCDCYVSLHRAEGWGFGMIEAMNLKVPVICTAYSGNMDFCSPETAWLVDCKTVPVPPGDYVYARADHRWAEPDIDDAARQMRAVRADPDQRHKRTAAAWRNVQDNFSVKAVSLAYRKRIEEILAARPRD